MLASITSVLSDLLALLPFMDAARAQIVINSFWPMLKGGIYYSIPLALISFAIGMVIALTVALIRIVPRAGWFHEILYRLARIYVSAIRGTPMLVQLFIIFYGLPSVGVKLDPFPSAIIAFFVEHWRLCVGNGACVDSVYSKRSMGSGLHSWFNLSTNLSPCDFAASAAGVGTAIVQYLYQFGKRHVFGVIGAGHGAV